MNKCFLQMTILILAGIVSGFGQTNAWNGLVPLRSTRADVEKLLGAPKENFYGTFKYESKDGRVEVYYSTQKCDGAWNVPVDTVLEIVVYPVALQGKKLEELKVDESKFSFTADDAFYRTWTNPEAGLQYYSDGRGEFISLTYLPRKSDNDLRCDGFPPFAPEGRHFTMERSLFYNPALKKTEGLHMIFARADGFLINLKNWDTENNLKGYVLVYFDNKLPFKEYRKRLDKLKEFLFEIRKADPQEVLVIEGGMREESLIEFYILPAKWRPPAPIPTLPSPQFMRKQ